MDPPLSTPHPHPHPPPHTHTLSNNGLRLQPTYGLPICTCISIHVLAGTNTDHLATLKGPYFDQKKTCLPWKCGLVFVLFLGIYMFIHPTSVSLLYIKASIYIYRERERKICHWKRTGHTPPSLHQHLPRKCTSFYMHIEWTVSIWHERSWIPDRDTDKTQLHNRCPNEKYSCGAFQQCFQLPALIYTYMYYGLYSSMNEQGLTLTVKPPMQRYRILCAMDELCATDWLYYRTNTSNKIWTTSGQRKNVSRFEKRAHFAQRPNFCF